MRWQRFFFFFLTSVLLWMGVACSQGSLNSPVASNPSPIVTPVQAVAKSSKPAEPAKPVEQPLPPETAAIVARAGSKGLYNPPRGQVRILVISDLNDSYGSTDYSPEVEKAMKLIPFWKPDLILCSGDMVAGQKPSLTPQEIRAMWAGFDKYIAQPIRQAGVPFGFTVGNHDASSARGVRGQFLFQGERDLAVEYWNNPKHGTRLDFIDRKEFPFYYTFKFKDVFVLVWDGSSSYIPPEKLKWVEKAFSSPEATQAKLRILVGHLPLYAVAEDRDQPGDVMDNADQLRSMLEKYRVHTYISGHHHAYYPAHKGKLQLLHTGLLGSGARPLLGSGLTTGKTLTVMDVNFDTPNLTTYTTYKMPSLERIEYSQLPRLVTGHNGTVLRRDVDTSQLSEVELATCKQQWGSVLCQA